MPKPLLTVILSLFIVSAADIAQSQSLDPAQQRVLNNRIADCRYSTLSKWSADPDVQDQVARQLTAGTKVEICGVEAHELKAGETVWAIIEAHVRSEMGLPPLALSAPSPAPEPSVAVAPVSPPVAAAPVSPPDPVIETAPARSLPPPPPQPIAEQTDESGGGWSMYMLAGIALIILAIGVAFSKFRKSRPLPLHSLHPQQ